MCGHDVEGPGWRASDPEGAAEHDGKTARMCDVMKKLNGLNVADMNVTFGELQEVLVALGFHQMTEMGTPTERALRLLEEVAGRH